MHAAGNMGHCPVVALLLATPGVDPLHKDKARGTCIMPACVLPCTCAFPIVQRGMDALFWAQVNRKFAAAALIEADPRVAAELAAAAASTSAPPQHAAAAGAASAPAIVEGPAQRSWLRRLLLWSRGHGR